MRRQLVRALGIASGAAGLGAGIVAMVMTPALLPPLDFAITLAMGISAAMVAVGAIDFAARRARGYRRLEIGVWGLVLIAVMTLLWGGPTVSWIGFYFTPAALVALAALLLANRERRSTAGTAASSDDLGER